MNPFKSIRWQLQVWHGAILLGVLTAFGFTAYRLAWENRFALIDRDLQRTTDRIFRAMGPRPNPSEAESVSRDPFKNPQEAFAKAVIPDLDEYYIAFFYDGARIRSSTNAPHGVPEPQRNQPGSSNRTRGTFREHAILLPDDRTGIVVGRSIANDLADLWKQAIFTALAGAAVAALGLIGGWWLAARAIQPIDQISKAASKIANGDLGERINVPQTENELGQLANTLNTTFDRLHAAYEDVQSAFERQRAFTADASHELRTPVSVILAETSSSLSRERTPAEYKESLDAIQRSARRMRQLTESLLTLARLDSSQDSNRRACDISGIARETIDALRPLANQHKVTVTSDLQPAIGIIDPERIAQVITNLLSNAIYYNRLGGEVRVKTSADGKQCVIVVSDNGQGISAEDLPHIFERFYRADKCRSPSNGRAGLGLAIAKVIVDQHGGSLNVASVPDSGSTFTVRLPK